MDEDIKKKLKQISDSLIEKRGSLKLFACVKTNEEKKWDIIVCASWVDYEKLKEYIGLIFDEFKPLFNGEFGLLFSSINPLKVDEAFAQEIIQIFGMIESPKEVKDVSVKGVKISEMVIVYSNPE